VGSFKLTSLFPTRDLPLVQQFVPGGAIPCTGQDQYGLFLRFPSWLPSTLALHSVARSTSRHIISCTFVACPSQRYDLGTSRRIAEDYDSSYLKFWVARSSEP
ncbi:unnamed protein product, partial [Ascophyllum nodosum]